MLRRINISAALIVLICFFLPWEQVSCGGERESFSGLYLARHDQTLLFLIPLLMLAVIVVGVVRRRHEKPGLLAIVGIAAGSATTLLMNAQRGRVQSSTGLIAAQLTGWFWLAFLSSLAVTITAIGRLLTQAKDGAR